jgi:phage tail-like protein
MNAAHRRLVLCKREDWRIIRSDNVELVGDAITARRAEYSTAYVCLGAIDGGGRGFEWGRVSLETLLPSDTSIRVYAFCSDVLERVADDGEYLPAGSGDDFYLDLEGRYLWLKFVFTCSESSPVLRAVRLAVSGDHMADYLPGIYRDGARGGGFTRRFLSVFDSIVTDMERQIDALPSRFDIDGAEGEMLRYLAGWLCVDDADAAAADGELREYVRNLPEVYGSMYTVEGVKRSVTRLCGRTPLIIESADVDPNGPDCPDSGLYRRLYGENPYRFFILLPEDTFPDSEALELFTNRLGGMIPANTSFVTIPLALSVQLDRHSYLNINSMVSGYTPAVIDESRAINFDMTIGG